MSETKVAPPTVRFFDENQNMVHLDVHGSNLDKFGSLPISISEMSRGVEKKPSCRVRLWHWVIMSSLFCLLLWSMIWLVRFDSHKCLIDQKEVNACVRRLLFFSSEVSHFPNTSKQLDHYCKEKSHSIQCLRNYVDSCLEVDKRQKRYFKKFVLNYKKQLDKTCLHGSEREKFISYSGCLSESELIRNATQCMDVHQNQLLYIAENVPENRRMAAACCSLHLRHTCLNTNITHQCQKQVQRFVMDQIEGPYRSLVSNICSPNYLSLADCQRKIEAPLWEKIFEKSSTLVRKVSNNDTLTTEITETEHEPHEMMDSTESQTGADHDHHIRTKIVQLKFQESFLAIIFIMRHSN